MAVHVEDGHPPLPNDGSEHVPNGCRVRQRRWCLQRVLYCVLQLEFLASHRLPHCDSSTAQQMPARVTNTREQGSEPCYCDATEAYEVFNLLFRFALGHDRLSNGHLRLPSLEGKENVADPVGSQGGQKSTPPPRHRKRRAR
jgi:hypothetical protein